MGQLGVGDDASYSSPVHIKTLGQMFITDVACGYYHTVFLSNAGNVFVCGGGDKGQLGLGSTVVRQSVPQQLTFPWPNSCCVSVSAGLFHNCALVVVANPDSIASYFAQADRRSNNKLMAFPLMLRTQIHPIENTTPPPTMTTNQPTEAIIVQTPVEATIVTEPTKPQTRPISRSRVFAIDAGKVLAEMRAQVAKGNESQDLKSRTNNSIEALRIAEARDMHGDKGNAQTEASQQVEQQQTHQPTNTLDKAADCDPQQPSQPHATNGSTGHRSDTDDRPDTTRQNGDGDDNNQQQTQYTAQQRMFQPQPPSEPPPTPTLVENRSRTTSESVKSGVWDTIKRHIFATKSEGMMPEANEPTEAFQNINTPPPSTPLLLSWGLNSHGQLGYRTHNAFQNTPRVVPAMPTGRDIWQVVCGKDFSMAILAEGGVSSTQDSSQQMGAANTSEAMAGTLEALWAMKNSASDNKASEATAKQEGTTLQKWRTLLQKGLDLKAQPTQVLLKRGIPVSIRPEVWLEAVGNSMLINPALYYCFAARAQACLNDQSPGALAGLESSAQLILRDMPRTLPQLAMFDERGPFFEELRTLLQVWVFYRPDVGYTQGMSYVAAMALLHMKDAPQAFQLFANVLCRLHLLTLYRVDLVDFRGHVFDVFNEACAVVLPSIHNRLKHFGVLPDQYLIKWLLSMFVQYFADRFEVSCRVWDRFLLDGFPVLIQVSLGVLLSCKEMLIQAQDMGECSVIFRKLPESVSDEKLFEAIDSIKLPNKVLNTLALLQTVACEHITNPAS
eukprot:c19062_g1_i3.p1 GENE.c19062_g1_i3~~c19062_g1_i3.p1  ORF type:complete len:784 (+),score=174.73 c19062_g1_i3:868-3219(+)